MEVESFEDAAAFRSVADSLLLAEEAVNNLILGVTSTVIHDPDTFEGFGAWVALEAGVPVAAAARTPPHNLILAQTTSEPAVHALADQIDDLPGVVGVSPSVHRFAEARPEPATLTMSQGVFRLSKVVPPAPVEGLSRQARSEEVDQLVELRLAFEEEAIGHVDDPVLSRRSTEWRIEEQSPRFGLWVHEVKGEVVCISGHSGPTPNGIRIGPVYTPPQHRGRGYASNLVASESKWLLDQGHRYCFLYTDLANTTSNSIYTKLGYSQIAESAEYTFNPSV